jgi:hypothetical protein
MKLTQSYRGAYRQRNNDLSGAQSESLPRRRTIETLVDAHSDEFGGTQSGDRSHGGGREACDIGATADSNLKLRVEDATRYYGIRTDPVYAVENVSFDVREGEMVCVLGPSGCGGDLDVAADLPDVLDGLEEQAPGLFIVPAPDVIKNDYVAGANAFDKGKVKADADGYKLPDDYASIDVKAIRKAL